MKNRFKATHKHIDAGTTLHEIAKKHRVNIIM